MVGESFTCPCGHTTSLREATLDLAWGVFRCAKCRRKWRRTMAGGKVLVVQEAQ